MSVKTLNIFIHHSVHISGGFQHPRLEAGTFNNWYRLNPNNGKEILYFVPQPSFQSPKEIHKASIVIFLL